MAGKNNTVVLVILLVLVVISVVQAVQLNTLKEKVSEGSLSVSASRVKSTASAPSGTSASTVPANLQNLPQMVGGC